jgi:hypothetical protein
VGDGVTAEVLETEKALLRQELERLHHQEMQVLTRPAVIAQPLYFYLHIFIFSPGETVADSRMRVDFS